MSSVVLAVLALAAVLYVLAAVDLRWSPLRTVSWLAGLAVAAAGLTGPLAAAHGDLRAHLAAHLLAGMVAPLLLVLAAPVTLLLRALPVHRARTVSRLLRTAPARVLGDPFVAVALNVGGLWVLHVGGLLGTVAHSPGWHLLVSLHVLVTGWLATAAVLAVDPAPHRRGVVPRAVALGAGMAGHDVLAKWLYAHPPAGVTHAEAGARLLYDGGTVVHVVVAALLWRQWYRSRAAVRDAEQMAGQRPWARA
ncbi:cytochrome c oxidase assembly protein [Modestobacter sp. VKM Ac-2983]|uniref:cytochrome c oxidase assembly protein n=1 Tax=Modestobacter sp. VKM Ac-2983 TaxID=3004137 RepID=UPI0022AB587C|nr:cytochrome c oxidase assembly protein [Modestobacter sp. VKM Ac-2983]MCZ2804270.1 cytochrome c oxidase assembly protein [Modestobacter sp. VKM Ac-2983]